MNVEKRLQLTITKAASTIIHLKTKEEMMTTILQNYVSLQILRNVLRKIFVEEHIIEWRGYIIKINTKLNSVITTLKRFSLVNMATIALFLILLKT